MINKNIRVLNFDDSVTAQHDLLLKYNAEIMDLRDIGPKVRFWLNSKDRGILEERLLPSSKNSVTFLGSGDFHHVSYFLIKQFIEPICVIDFDFHPDWTLLPPHLTCGSWATEVLKHENILKFIMIGVSSDDLSTFSIQEGNFAALENDRLEIYPYSHQPTTVFFRKIPENTSMELKKSFLHTKIFWNELIAKNSMEFLLHILRRLPTKKVYLTIDKDCLMSSHALTNWEGGRMSLDELLSMIKIIKDHADIVGADITGEYSKINIKGVVKGIVCHFDHPKNYSAKNASSPEIVRINEETNLRIMEALA